MATDHRFMPSSEVHEPKHISTSTTADAGKVITPDFTTNGESILRYLTASDVGLEPSYGEVALDQNSTGFSIPVASDPTLYTESDYVQLDSVRAPGAYLDHNNNVTFAGADNSLTPTVSGDYKVSFWVNATTDVNNSKLGFKAKENGVWCNFTVKHDIPAIGRVQYIGGSIITDLTAGNPVTLWIASDKAATITILDMRFYIELLKAA